MRPRCTLSAVLLALCLVDAQTQLGVQLFTDNRCNVPSTTATNTSFALDTCVTTIGLESFSFTTSPCGGGGETSVKVYAFTDQRCVKGWVQWEIYASSSCRGAYEAGNAFGSMLLTCKTNPGSGVAVSTVTVGPVATGASLPASSTSSTNSSGGTSNNSGSSSSTSNPNTASSEVCYSFGCLTTGERIGIIVALGVGIPPIFFGLYAFLRSRNKDKKKLIGSSIGTDGSSPQFTPLEQHPSHRGRIGGGYNNQY